MDELKRYKNGALDMYIRAQGQSSAVDQFIIGEVQQVYFWDEIDVLRPRVIVDIGANIGAYSAFAARRYPDARVIGVEPVRDNYALAVLNTSDYDNVTMVNGYVGYDGMPHLVVIDPDNVGGHKVLATNAIPADAITQKSPPRYSVEDILWEHALAKIDVLKLDCEGAEYEILPHVMPQFVRVVLGEYHGTHEDFITRIGSEMQRRYAYWRSFAIHPHLGMFLGIAR